MEKLRAYLNDMPSEKQDEFAKACKTTIGSLRTAMSKNSAIGPAIAVAIEKNSGGAVTRQDLRTDWADIWPELVKAA
jgi:DNA-binding transcriptional regulator YdaS (Cro superfamily)